MTLTPITLANLTAATLDGEGVFDVLMRANKAHLENEFSKGRIKGPEYATVYLGSLDTVMNASLQFLLQRDKVTLEAQLLEQQVLLATSAVAKSAAEILQVQAQTALITQQKTNLIAEALNIPKQGNKLDADVAMTTQQTANLVTEELFTDAKIAQTGQQTTNLVSENANISKQGSLIDAQKDLAAQQKLNLEAEELSIDAKTNLITAQVASEGLRNDAVDGNIKNENCKLKAEYDVLMATELKIDQEKELLLQKTSTEKAQVTTLGVDADSVVGRQKALYAAQTSGFTRDAEQKAAKVMVDSWNVRRTTDETGTDGNITNKLDDTYVGRAVTKLLDGVGA